MLNVSLAGGYLCRKQLFTWLSLVVSLMGSFVLSFFPLDVLGEIWDLIESVSEGFLTYSYHVYYHLLLFTSNISMLLHICLYLIDSDKTQFPVSWPNGCGVLFLPG